VWLFELINLGLQNQGSERIALLTRGLFKLWLRGLHRSHGIRHHYVTNRLADVDMNQDLADVNYGEIFGIWGYAVDMKLCHLVGSLNPLRQMRA